MNLDIIDAKIAELEKQKADFILNVNILEGGLFALRQMREQVANPPVTDPVTNPASEPSVIVAP